ncbi:MAG: DcaP family trimeric outer membrane transporter [Candidatus Omnitrophota bacterium]|nr:hypothetical protein [Candidatus Omnitrophota bacterium]
MRKQKMKILLTAIIFSFSSMLCAFADDASKEELIDRVSSLESEIGQLKAMISNMQTKQYRVEEKVEKIAANPVSKTAAITTGITSKHDVKLYGFLKLDATYDDSKTDDVDAARFAQSPSTSTNEEEFSMTARNSRIGLNYSGPQENDVKAVGNLEMDFYDTVSAHHSTQLRMRHAFVELQYPKWSVLAGQTGDVFAPLGPDTLNTNGYLFNGGNMGFRRAQIRLTNNFDINRDNKITTQLSLNRNGNLNDGPVLEGRTAYTFPFFGRKSTVGVEGLYGQDTSVDRVPYWAGGVDVSLALMDKVSLKGEFFRGANLNDFLAGIGQGINATTNDGIDTVGGWAQLSYKPWDKYCFNLGYGIDSPKKRDLNNGNRSKNEVVLASVMYSLMKDVKLGLEYSYFQTQYLNADEGKNNKITTSVIYSF